MIASAPATTDYETCMDYCMPERDDFAYCDSICSDKKAEDGGGLQGADGVCSDSNARQDFRKKQRAIWREVAKRFSPHSTFVVTKPTTDEYPNIFEISIAAYEPDVYCMAVVSVDELCRVVVLDVIELATAELDATELEIIRWQAACDDYLE